MKNLRFVPKSLHFFTIQSKVVFYKEEEHLFIENNRDKRGLSDSLKRL